MNAKMLIENAKKRVAEFDAIDANSGFATPQEVGLREVIHVCLAALATGINTDNWDCVADAFVMLGQLAASAKKEKSYAK